MQATGNRAFTDYYPTGETALGKRDDKQPASWVDDEIVAISELSGRPPEQNILLSTDYKLLSFQPYWGFQDETPHYANPLSQYDKRADEIERWAGARSGEELLDLMEKSEFHAPNVFVLSNPESSFSSKPPTKDKQGKLGMRIRRDAFPRLPNIRDYDVYFDRAVFDSPRFAIREVGPYTIIALR